jgi:hypothetical protein
MELLVRAITLLYHLAIRGNVRTTLQRSAFHAGYQGRLQLEKPSAVWFSHLGHLLDNVRQLTGFPHQPLLPPKSAGSSGTS